MTNNEYKPYFYVVGFLFTAIAVMIFTNMNFGLTTHESIGAGFVTAILVLIVVYKID